MIKPIKTVFFFIIVGFFLAISMLLLPDDGIEYLGFKIHMPTFEDMLSKDSTSYADISDITKNIDNIDSLLDITQISDIAKTDSSSIDSNIIDS
ncbi:MAG: hypothetical protein KAG84_03405, partial [Bacteroidales bacterium]|nr:hypothetical protein [Bacteroidales bacterium]